MATQFDLFQRAVLEYLIPYLRKAARQEEHIQAVIAELKVNIRPQPER